MRPVFALLMLPLALSGCSEPEGARVEGATADGQARHLLVLPAGDEVEMLARLSGTVEVNEAGCFTLDDEVLIVESGAEVLDDGAGISLPRGAGDVRVGSTLTGVGGHLDDVAAIAKVLDAHQLTEPARECDEHVSFVMLDAD